MSRSQAGFSIVESMVAMALIVIGALALAVTLAGGAAINSRTNDRQKALALAEQTLSRIQSLPYAQVGLAPAAYTASGPPTCTTAYPGSPGTTVTDPSASDPARSATDWYCGASSTTVGYCPVASPGTCNDNSTQSSPFTSLTGGRIVTITGTNWSSLGTNDPRKAKRSQNGGNTTTAAMSVPATYRKDGMIVYTYIYYPVDIVDPTKLSRSTKIATVIVRFRDSAAGTPNPANGIVRLSAAIVDNPGLGQIPTVDTVQCSDGLDNDGDNKIDQADPQCHVDGTATNPNTYDATIVSES